MKPKKSKKEDLPPTPPIEEKNKKKFIILYYSLSCETCERKTFGQEVFNIDHDQASLSLDITPDGVGKMDETAPVESVIPVKSAGCRLNLSLVGYLLRLFRNTTVNRAPRMTEIIEASGPKAPPVMMSGPLTVVLRMVWPASVPDTARPNTLPCT